MRYLIIVLQFLIINHNAWGQDKNLLLHQKHFDKELKEWTETFNNFDLSVFKVEDTLHFDNNFKNDFSNYKKFLSTYKPIITYSSDSSQFIDIYSYQLNLERKGNYYCATPDLEQVIFLCNPQKKYWNRIWFGTNSQWADEIIWISKTKFILVGVIKSVDYKNKPFIFLGDTDKQILVSYLSKNKNSYQSKSGYSSPKLKRLRIRGI